MYICMKNLYIYIYAVSVTIVIPLVVAFLKFDCVVAHRDWTPKMSRRREDMI